MAAHQGHMEVVKALLQANGSIEIKDEDGDTALHYTAFGWGTTHISLFSCNVIVHLQMPNKTAPPPLLSFYIMFHFSNQAEIARLLLSKGANVNLLNNSMCTALHIAVNKGFADLVRMLTEHSADVNLQVKLCRAQFDFYYYYYYFFSKPQ